MNTIEYDRMAKMEKDYWWHVGRLKILDEQLRKLSKNRKLKILNIGCGTGGTIKMLEKHGEVINADISDDAIKYMQSLGFENTTKVDGILLPFEDDSFDIVAAFDVLEHIEDDVEALKEWRRVLKPSGHILVTVPAYQWLWSQHDVSLQHYRRYTRKSLKASGEEAGLRSSRLSYAIAFSLPLVSGFRFANKALQRQANAEASYVIVPGLVNKTFIKLLEVEGKAHNIIKLPFGTTVMARFSKE